MNLQESHIDQPQGSMQQELNWQEGTCVDRKMMKDGFYLKTFPGIRLDLWGMIFFKAFFLSTRQVLNPTKFL